MEVQVSEKLKISHEDGEFILDVSSSETGTPFKEVRTHVDQETDERTLAGASIRLSEKSALKLALNILEALKG